MKHHGSNSSWFINSRSWTCSHDGFRNNVFFLPQGKSEKFTPLSILFAWNGPKLNFVPYFAREISMRICLNCTTSLITCILECSPPIWRTSFAFALIYANIVLQLLYKTITVNVLFIIFSIQKTIEFQYCDRVAWIVWSFGCNNGRMLTVPAHTYIGPATLDNDSNRNIKSG